MQWRCGGGFCSGSVLVWIGDREFGFWWVSWIFVGFGLCFWFWVCFGVVGIADGFVGFVGGRWFWVLWVQFFNFFFSFELEKGKREDSREG